MGDPFGNLAGRMNTGGYEVDPAGRRAALVEALMRTGAGLSQGAMKPVEEGGGFAAIAPALVGGMSGMRERFAESDALARQREEEKRRHQLFEEQLAGAKQSRELATKGEEREATKFNWTKDELGRQEAERGATVKGVTDMVAVIEADAGPDSPEARQARALATLGSKADLQRLAGIHDDLQARKRKPEEDARILALKREDDARRIAEGLEIAPEREFNLKQRQLSAYERQVQEQGRRTTTIFGQMADDLRATEEDLYKRYENEEKAKLGENPLPVMDKSGKMKTGPGGAPIFPQVPYEDVRRRARVDALNIEWKRRGFSLSPVENVLGFRLQNPEFVDLAYQQLAAGADPRMIAAQIREAREAYFRAQGRR